MERLIMTLDEEDGWRDSEKERLKVGIGFVWEKEENKVRNVEMKFKGLEIQAMFSLDSKVVLEFSTDFKKIDKQMQYFDKVRVI